MTNILRILINLNVCILQWLIKQQKIRMCKMHLGDCCPYNSGGFWSDCHLEKTFCELNMIYICREDFND